MDKVRRWDTVACATSLTPPEVGILTIAAVASYRDALLPSWERMAHPSVPHVFTHISIPLRLLAAICLAWPVTSLLLLLLARRRRKGRGFEVEASAASSTPLPLGEVAAQRSGADGEGGHHHATGSSS